ncbi:MAG: 3-isopropylmalate dehydratase small subunit [Gammaproteobacteria bacterium]|nr:3-isopropylmalate dehydratase small subunit [Gammaproteobacteria bacterium]
MEKFNILTSIAMPLDRANVDTDAIIPKQFLKSIKRSGFGPNLFDQWRYLDEGQPGMDNLKRPLNNDFVLNKPEYQGAKILVAKKNFGCGSSREHAPWALEDYGFRVIVAPSFADIFYNNCFKNGILPVILSESEVEDIFSIIANNSAEKMIINLPNQSIQFADKSFKFDLDEFRKFCLLEGLDEIGLTLEQSDKIKAFETKAKQNTPWLF